MKLSKTILSLTLCLILACSAAVMPASAKKTKEKELTLSRYTEKSFMFSKPKNRVYKCKVKKNKKYIKAKVQNIGKKATLTITANKLTRDKSPVVYLYYRDDDEAVIVKKYTVTVTPLEQLELEDVKANSFTTKKVTFKNPYTMPLRFKYSTKKHGKFLKNPEINGKSVTYIFKAKKYGKARVSVYLGDTNKKVGSFYLKSGKVKASVAPEYKTLTLYYNKHGSSVFMNSSHTLLSNLLTDVKYKGKYTVEIDDASVADRINTTSTPKNGESKKTEIIYSTGIGTTTATVYEKAPKVKKRAVDKFKIKVKKCKMSYVASQNLRLYDFGDIFEKQEETTIMVPGHILDLKKAIVDALINNTWTGSSFRAKDYKISYRAMNPSYVTVTNGRIVAKKPTAKTVRVKFRIDFSDESSFTKFIPIQVING